ncbi:MAG: hypothetical protein M1817_004794 [Caeruleum heppii]|nr:MAG: hypothetical protein M1817_004794 [Caeruleum heppii]
MTASTLPPPRPPKYKLQPHPKAPPTSSTTPFLATGASLQAPPISTSSASSRAASPQPPVPDHDSVTARPSPTSPASRRPTVSASRSDRATTVFIRRILCAHHVHSTAEKDRNIHDLLPSLTSSNDIDLQLYGFIAIIIRDFVASWYAKITPDHGFVDEVLLIIAHCTRGVEERLRKVDLVSVVLDEVPALVNDHIVAYRTSERPSQTHPFPTSPHAIYHTLLPHPALSPVPCPTDISTLAAQNANETAYRHMLIDRILAVLLPVEDYQNDCLRALVVEILSELVVGRMVVGKMCDSVVWYKGITNAVEAYQDSKGRERDLERQKRARDDEDPQLKDNTSFFVRFAHSGHQLHILLLSILSQTIHSALLTLTLLRLLTLSILTAVSLPPRHQTPPKPPILTLSVFHTATHLSDLPRRMPWLHGILQLLQHLLLTGPGHLGATDGPLDRWLAHHLRPPPAERYLPALLRSLRTSLFPLNTTLHTPSSASGVQDPSTEEDAHSRRRRRRRRSPYHHHARTHCARTLLALIPPRIRTIYLATSDETSQTTQISHLLGEIFDDEEVEEEEEEKCKDGEEQKEEVVVEEKDEEEAEISIKKALKAYRFKHLIYRILELLIVRIMPELGER